MHITTKRKHRVDYDDSKYDNNNCYHNNNNGNESNNKH